MSNDNKESQFYLVGHKLINVIYINNNFDNGIFHGIDTYDHLETRANTGFLPLVYNRVGVGQIWHWLAPAGIKAQYSYKTNNLSSFLSGNIWHWQASASS